MQRTKFERHLDQQVAIETVRNVGKNAALAQKQIDFCPGKPVVPTQHGTFCIVLEQPIHGLRY